MQLACNREEDGVVDPLLQLWLENSVVVVEGILGVADVGMVCGRIV